MSHYQMANRRPSAPLTEAMMMQMAPSIFAVEAHESRSDRYTYIPTIEVLRGLMNEGFQPFKVNQGRTRVPGKSEYTRHMIHLRHADLPTTEDGTQEIIITNSHDGTSAYIMESGYYRQICSNGLMCFNPSATVKAYHRGAEETIHNVIEGAFTIIDRSKEIGYQIQDMTTIDVNPVQAEIMARAMLAVRFPDGSPISERQALQPQRYYDTGTSLWTTWNRVQENITKGGMMGRDVNNRQRRVRAVTGMDSDAKLQRGLWQVLEAMRSELKAA